MTTTKTTLTTFHAEEFNGGKMFIFKEKDITKFTVNEVKEEMARKLIIDKSLIIVLQKIKVAETLKNKKDTEIMIKDIIDGKSIKYQIKKNPKISRKE